MLTSKRISRAREARPPKNKAERECWDRLIAAGWLPMKKGWPDFGAFKDGKFIVIEVKPRESHPLKKSQHTILRALRRYGIPAYKWSPDGGFERITIVERSQKPLDTQGI